MRLDPEMLKLCLITDPILCAGYGLERTVEAALAGGATMVQLRDKTADKAGRIAAAQRLKPVTRKFGVPLIINDDVAAALAVGADGLHIGRNDMPPAAARRLIGRDMILGLSATCGVTRAPPDPALVDYVGIGPVFPTTGKKDHDPPIGFAGLARLCAATPLPCIAIGGLNGNHCRQVLQAGADGIAVISTICGAPDPEAATRDIIARMLEKTVTASI